MNQPLKAFMLGAVLLLATSTLHAQNMCGWIKNGGNMNDPTGWSTYPALPMPAAYDWLWITAGNTMNITADFQGGIPEYMYVGRTYAPYGFSGDGAVLQTGGNLVLNSGIRGIGRGGSSGTYTMQYGTIAMNGIGSGVPLLIGQDAGSSGTMTLWNNSQVTAVGEGDIGFGGSGTLILNDISKFAITSLIVGNGSSGSGILTLNNSSSLTTALTITSTGTVDLNGTSTLITPRVIFDTEFCSMSVDGGTIKATASSSPTSYFMNVFGNVYIKSGGATFDTNGYDIIVDASLTEGTTLGGGLTKKGAGTLILRQTSYYTGPTTLQAGGLRVDNLATLPGNLTVPAGCSFGGLGTLGGTLTTQNNSTLKFTTGDILSLNAPPAVAATTIVEPTYSSPTSPAATWTVMQWTKVTGEANPVPNLKLSVDSIGVNAISLAYGPDAGDATKSDVNILAAPITNEWKGPVGNNNYSTAANWTNHVPSGGSEIALFGTTGTAGAVNVDSARTLSSLIFNSSGSYALSGSPITLNSSIALNSQITAMQGAHTIGNNLALARNTQIHIYDPGAAGYSLAINGVVSGTGKLSLDGGGMLALNGMNTFSGPVVMAGYSRLEVGNLGPTTAANALGQSAPDASNLIINGTLAYTGTASTPTTVATDRGFTLVGTSEASYSPIDVIEVQNANVNLKFTGLATTGSDCMFNKKGPGTLTLSNAGANTLASGLLQVSNGTLVLENGTFTKGNVTFPEGTGDFSVATVPGQAASMTIDKGAKVSIGGLLNVGSSGSTGSLKVDGGSNLVVSGISTIGWDATLTVTGDSQVTFQQLSKFGYSGSCVVNIDGTSAASHSTVNNMGANWIGGKEGPDPPQVTINMTGYGEMHSWGSNTHLGSGVGTKVDFLMSGHSQYVYEGTNTWANDGLVDIGDYGATANVVMNDSATFLNPHGYVTIGGNVERRNMGGKGTFTMNGSTTFTSGRAVCVGDSVVEGVLTLNGGVFTAPAITKGATSVASTINFNGGTLKASTGVLGWYDAQVNQTATGLGNFIQGTGFAVNVLEGGAKFDSNGLAVTITQQFQHAGTAATDGGFTKLGTGSLTLFSKSNYTGPTVVKDGTLKLVSNIVSQMATAPDNAAGDRGDGPYALGRDFTVNAGKTIQVTQLGVFDSLGDGLEASHVVHITNVDTSTDSVVTTIASGTSATYQHGFRFVALGSPLSLAAGNYRVWVESIGGSGNDAFSGNLVNFDAGYTGAMTIGASYYNVTTGVIPSTPWNDGSGNADADATFSFYDPAGVIAANALPSTTPVLLGGAAGSTPKLDLQGVNQQIASLADVAGSVVKGSVTNSLTSQEVALTLGATAGTTTYGGSIEGNLSLVKTGASNQILSGSLTYTGNTDIQAGELAVAGTATLTTVTGSSSGVLHVCDGASLTATSIELGTLVIGGAPPASAAAVPEPGTLGLLAVAALGLAGWMLRKK